MNDKIIYPNKKPDYIGLKINDGEFTFIFPCNYQKSLTDSEEKNDMLNILKVIDKYKTLEKVNDNYKKENLFPFNSYLWLLKDYLKNGYYVTIEKNFIEAQKGKINWKKTIKNNDIFLSNKTLIYRNFIVNHKQNDVENIITNIHKFCIEDAVNKMGWFFNLNSSIIDKNYEKYTKKVMLSLLKKTYNETFIDYKKELIFHMIKIIEGLDINSFNTRSFDLSTKEFEYVFERLIDDRFGTEKKELFNPVGYWYINKNEYKSSNLRPDTIMIKDNVAFIIDAKYYNYGYTKEINDLPDTSSIQKQVTYAEEFKSRNNIKEIYNVFILPTSSNKYIECFGYAFTSWKNSGETYERIYSFLIDLKSLINDSNLTKEKNQNLFLKEFSYYKHKNSRDF